MSSEKVTEQLKKNLKTAKSSIDILEGQVKDLEKNFDCVIETLEGEDKCRVQELRALTNRALKVARNGGDYNAVLQQIQEKFKMNV